MATKTLKNVRIQFLTKIATEWVTENTVLFDGEIGIEKDTNKFKIGDGATAWNDLEYASADASAVAVTPDMVVFNDDLTFTYAFGKYTPGADGSVLVPAKDKSIQALFLDAFSEEKAPTVTNPSATVTSAECHTYEVGNNVTPTYNVAFNPGKYSFGPATGVTPVAYSVSFNNETKNTATGTFNQITVTDDTNMRIAAQVSYNDATNPPNNNLGAPVPDKKINAGAVTAYSSSITGYRNSFYGYRTTKGVLSSGEIRGLQGKSNKALANGATFDVVSDVGAQVVVIAYPATLRAMTKVLDVNGMNANVTSSFKEQTVQVTGAGGQNPIAYRVYTMEYASPNQTRNTFKVTI